MLLSWEYATIAIGDSLYEPTIQQCYEYLNRMRMNINVVEMIEGATRGQSDCE